MDEQENQAWQENVKCYNESLSKIEMIIGIIESCYDASIIFAEQGDKETAMEYAKLADDFMRDAYNLKIMGDAHV